MIADSPLSPNHNPNIVIETTAVPISDKVIARYPGYYVERSVTRFKPIFLDLKPQS